jgi:exodeoxyribonuclease III
MLKILSWNIQQGGGSRSMAICQALAQSGAHIIQLSEFKNNENGAFIKTQLQQAGYIFQYFTAAFSDQNSVLIASKINGEILLFPDADPVFQHNIIGVQFSAFTLLGAYMPHKKKHVLFTAVSVFIKNTTLPAILVGDYNTGINHIDQKGDSFWYQSEMVALPKLGLQDAFRHLNGNIEEYSWYSHQGNGFRYDHTYLSQDLLPVLKGCSYLHAWRENGLSDHSPMIVEIG